MCFLVVFVCGADRDDRQVVYWSLMTTTGETPVTYPGPPADVMEDIQPVPESSQNMLCAVRDSIHEANEWPSPEGVEPESATGGGLISNRVYRGTMNRPSHRIIVPTRSIYDRARMVFQYVGYPVRLSSHQIVGHVSRLQGDCFPEEVNRRVFYVCEIRSSSHFMPTPENDETNHHYNDLHLATEFWDQSPRTMFTLEGLEVQDHTRVGDVRILALAERCTVWINNRVLVGQDAESPLLFEGDPDSVLCVRETLHPMPGGGTMFILTESTGTSTRYFRVEPIRGGLPLSSLKIYPVDTVDQPLFELPGAQE